MVFGLSNKDLMNFSFNCCRDNAQCHRNIANVAATFGRYLCNNCGCTGTDEISIALTTNKSSITLMQEVNTVLPCFLSFQYQYLFNKIAPSNDNEQFMSWKLFELTLSSYFIIFDLNQTNASCEWIIIISCV